MNDWLLHFRVFGFALFRDLFSRTEMSEITLTADRLLCEDRKGADFEGAERQQLYGIVESDQVLRNLLTDERICQIASNILGEDFVWLGSDGNLYVGDTGWHSDGGEHYYRRVKMLFYLDQLTPTTGALRVIPGSHKQPFYTELLPLLGRPDGRVTPFGVRAPKRERTDASGFGVHPVEIPAFATETFPGDLIVIDQNLWHASFGGASGRRMLSLSFGEQPTCPEHFELIQAIYAGQMEHITQRQLTPKPFLFHPEFLAMADARILRMLVLRNTL